MREVISLHVGNAGVNLGDSCWELFCLEHGIDRDGFLKETEIHSDDRSFQTHFVANSVSEYHPRAVFIDLDPSRIEEIQTSRMKKLYTKGTYFVNGNEGTSSIFSSGYVSKNSVISEQIEEKIRKLADDCTGLQGFCMHHNIGGGTGSGCSTRILKDLTDDYARKSKITITMFPSLTSMTSILEPYNVILSLHCLLEDADNCVCISNDALIRMSQKITSRHRPSYNEMNSLTKQLVSSITSSQRFDGALNVDITEFQTGLVPYPRIHFLIPGFTPYVPIFEDYKRPMTTLEITRSIVHRDSNLSNVDPRLGKYMSFCLMYRGDVIPKEINIAVADIKNNMKDDVKFVDWSPTGFKCGVNYHPPKTVEGDGLGKVTRCVGSLSSNTVIGEQLIRPFYVQADKMFRKKAYLHWIVNGEGSSIEEEDLREAFEDVRYLLLDYEEIGAEYTVEGVGEEEGEIDEDEDY